MIIEGRKITAFDAMEAAMELSGMYMVRDLKDIVNFRYSQVMEAVVFEFGFWKGFDFVNRKSFVVYLDNTRTGNTFTEVFNEIESEKERITRYE